MTVPPGVKLDAMSERADGCTALWGRPLTGPLVARALGEGDLRVQITHNA